MPSHHSCLSTGPPLAGKAPAGMTNGFRSTASLPLFTTWLSQVLHSPGHGGGEIHLDQLDGLGTNSDH